MNPAGNKLLLSVVIPTKNRQYTCLYAIESVLKIDREDIEVVVQDCSDTNILWQQVLERFGNDPRISYEHVDTKPSMTDNWNRAFERSRGRYRCGIGDDDAVMPVIYEVAQWADKNNIDAVGHRKRFEYFWSDYTFTPAFAGNLRVNVPERFNEVSVFKREDLDRIIARQSAIPNMDYRQLPMVYHCLLAGKVVESLYQKTGKLVDGTSFDVYSAFALGLTINTYYVLDMPFTLPGACGSSNSNRIPQKNFNKHFSEFKTIDIDPRIPTVYNLPFTITESTQKAFANLHNTYYPQLLDLPHLYYEFIIFDFNSDTFKKVWKLMKANKFSLKDYFVFSFLFFIKIFKVIYNRTAAVFHRLGFKPKPLPLYPATDIIEASGIIPANDLAAHNIAGQAANVI